MLTRTFGAFLIAVAALAGCDVSPTHYRVRMVVDVETPQGMRSGSGVIEISAGKGWALLPEESMADVSLRGQAVIIDLPGDRAFFALLRPLQQPQDLEAAVTSALDPQFRGGAPGFLESVPRLAAPGMRGRTVELPPRDYPLLVRFADPLVPGSVEAVPEATIRRVRLMITDEPPSAGIERLLPWLPGLRHNLDGSQATFSNRLANTLTSRDFVRH